MKTAAQKRANANWYRKHRDRILADMRAKRMADPELAKAQDRTRYERYRDAYLEKAARREAVKKAGNRDELTNLVYWEARRLGRLRSKLTGIRWHVDHIVPLQGKSLCGLHVWYNLAVIPARVNWLKGNRSG